MQFLDRQADMIRRAVAVLNLEAAELVTDAPSLVEVTTGVALAYLDFQMPYLEWHRGHEPLQKWLEVFAQRPSMISTAPAAA
jgi:glutathione S-transferase